MNRHDPKTRQGILLQVAVNDSTKRYTPVGNFERWTGFCPLYVAWLVLDEARDYLRVAIPDFYADHLAHRAEAVFAAHEFWRAKYCGRNGRQYLLMTMRHWLAAALAKDEPAWFRELPEGFLVGKPAQECRKSSSS